MDSTATGGAAARAELCWRARKSQARGVHGPPRRPGRPVPADSRSSPQGRVAATFPTPCRRVHVRSPASGGVRAANLFSTFVTLQAPTPTKLFHPIVRSRRRGRDFVASGGASSGAIARCMQRSHIASGAAHQRRSTAEQSSRPRRSRLVAELPKRSTAIAMTRIASTAASPSAASGVSATRSATPAGHADVTVARLSALNNAVVPSLDFDWSVDGNLEAASSDRSNVNSTAHAVSSARGRFELRELQGDVTADFDISGAGVAGTAVRGRLDREFTAFFTIPTTTTERTSRTEGCGRGRDQQIFATSTYRTRRGGFAQPPSGTDARQSLRSLPGGGAVRAEELVRLLRALRGSSQDASGSPSGWRGPSSRPSRDVLGARPARTRSRVRSALSGALPRRPFPRRGGDAERLNDSSRRHAQRLLAQQGSPGRGYVGATTVPLNAAF